jgi:hypothetical protein
MSNNHALLLAAVRGDEAQVFELLDLGVDVNAMAQIELREVSAALVNRLQHHQSNNVHHSHQRHKHGNSHLVILHEDVELRFPVIAEVHLQRAQNPEMGVRKIVDELRNALPELDVKMRVRVHCHGSFCQKKEVS